MGLIKSFERRFLFPLTRGLALFLISVLLIGIIGMGVKTSGSLSPSTKVTPDEVIRAIKPPVYSTNSNSNEETMEQTNSTSPGVSNDVLSGKKLPFQIQKYFNNPHNLDVLRGWLEQIPADRREEFLNELADTITAAEKSGVDVNATVNKYKEVKFSKLEKEDMAKKEIAQQRIYYVAAAFGSVTLIALFSLILVLLSIERNTRRDKA